RSPPDIYTVSLPDALPIWRVVLLEERLQAVGDRLEDAHAHEGGPDHGDAPHEEGRRAVRPDAVLDEGAHLPLHEHRVGDHRHHEDRKSTRLNSSHVKISYA